MFKDEYDWPNKPFLEYEKAEGRRPAHQRISVQMCQNINFHLVLNKSLKPLSSSFEYR